jgi:hypothetical protein
MVVSANDAELKYSPSGEADVSSISRDWNSKRASGRGLSRISTAIRASFASQKALSGKAAVERMPAFARRRSHPSQIRRGAAVHRGTVLLWADRLERNRRNSVVSRNRQGRSARLHERERAKQLRPLLQGTLHIVDRADAFKLKARWCQADDEVRGADKKLWSVKFRQRRPINISASNRAACPKPGPRIEISQGPRVGGTRCNSSMSSKSVP